MTPLEFDKALAEQMGTFFNDPYGFVMFSFPWGQKGTPLQNHTGPETWQAKVLQDLGEHISGNMVRKDNQIDLEPWMSATASGHGVGKSSLVAWIILFIMATRVDARGVVTANTESQLEKKTWPELSKWHDLFIAKHWFHWTSTQFYYKLYPENKRKNYCIDAVPWSEERSEGFAGLHNETSAVLVIMDEASAIPSKIWEVAEGAMTDGEPFWFTFGNPTRPDGMFFDCFHKLRAFWRKFHVDSRSVKLTNKSVLQRILDKYGEDSDEARVRVKGLFPKGDVDGYISPEDVADARERQLFPDPNAPLIMAVDVARFGDDNSVIRFRQGNDARSIPPRRYSKLTTEQLAAHCADAIDMYDPDAVVVEGSGVGGGLVDALRALRYKIIEINPGRVANNQTDYQNIRAEMYGLLREWLRKNGCIAEEPELESDLTKMRFTYDAKNRLLLESKKDMKNRGLASPDDGDSLGLTFTVKVARRDAKARRGKGGKQRIAKGVDYPLAN